MYDIGEFGDATFVAMEYVDGEDVVALFVASGIVPIVFVALLTIYGFRTALGGQQAISANLFDSTE